MDVGDTHSEPCWSSIPRGLRDTVMVHFWAASPLQLQSWMPVPLVALSPVSSRHLPLTRMVPSGSSVHFWAVVPLQVYSSILLPLAVLLPESSRHRPVMADRTAPAGTVHSSRVPVPQLLIC